LIVNGYYNSQIHNNNLVGGFSPAEKYESDWIIIPTIGENKKCSKPPTTYSVNN
jgi:hypothetical protein